MTTHNTSANITKHNYNAHFDIEFIKKNQINAPRYTSYPTADKFTNDYTQDMHMARLYYLKHLNNNTISLYIHIPFCNTLCLYCACNKIITNDRSNIDTYLTYLEKEFELYYKFLNKKLDVVQLHFGGGSPSWLDTTQINQIMNMINKYFNLANALEIAMEIDPRHVDEEFIKTLAYNKFNRISLGVQDFYLTTQKAVNRIQSYEKTKEILDYANKYNFKSTNIDLIYGLPYQTLESFSTTINLAIELNVARIALFNYAHLPSLFFSQTRIDENSLPDANTKLAILQDSVNKLLKANYVFIGMDHFAKPDDELAIATHNNTLHRNFQGYSTFANHNMLSFGASSIGLIGNTFDNRSYYQNIKDLNSYYALLDNGEFPIYRGIVLNTDDLIRATIIQNIMCKFSLNFESCQLS